MKALFSTVKEQVSKHIQAGNTLRFSNTCADSHWEVTAKPGVDEPYVEVSGYAEDHYGTATPRFDDLKPCDVLMLMASTLGAYQSY